MIFNEEFKIGLKDIDKENGIKNRAILEIFENIGAYHSDKAGYGVNDISKTGLTWILLDWKIKVINRPKYGQVLKVNTWGRKMTKFYTYRDYEIYDEKENLCVIGTSKWVLIDVKKGKITKITDEIINSYYPEEKSVFNEEKLDKIKLQKDFSNSIMYKVNRKDIDLNGHMHNLYYLDIAYEALPEEVYKKRPFNEVRISYKKEIKLGDIILCKYTKEGDKHIVTIENKDKNNVHAVVELLI